MKVQKAKVNYTETTVTLTGEDLRQIIAAHIYSEKGLEVDTNDVLFVIEHDGSSDPVVMGAEVKVLKRGRAQRNGHANGRKAKPAEPEVNFDEDEELAPKKKSKKSKKEQDDDDYGDE